MGYFGYGDTGESAKVHTITLPNGDEFNVYKVVTGEDFWGKNEYEYQVSGYFGSAATPESRGANFGTLEEAKQWITDEEKKNYPGYQQLDFSDLREMSGKKVGTGGMYPSEELWRDTILDYLIGQKQPGSISDADLQNLKERLDDYTISDLIDLEGEELIRENYGQTISQAFIPKDYSGGGSGERERKRDIQKTKRIAGGTLAEAMEIQESASEEQLAKELASEFTLPWEEA